MDLKLLLEWYISKKTHTDALVKFNSNHFDNLAIQSLIREYVDYGVINP
jgi:hypothetical protein